MKTSALLSIYLKKTLPFLTPFFRVSISGVLAYIVGFEAAIYFLILFILADFVTGFWAYCVENNVKFTLKGKWALQSDLLKRNGAKIGVYIIVILVIGAFEKHYFKIEFDAINKLAKRPVNGVALIAVFFWFVELLSIIENFKRIGFDLIGKLEKLYESFESLKTKIKKLLKW